MQSHSPAQLSWLGIVRLGLVQTALGAVVVLTTSTLNRVMVVELSLAAVIPGALVTLHHVMQLLRPRMGYGSDVGQRRTPWIVGGMVALALGGLGAAIATSIMVAQPVLGLALAIPAYAAIGAGVSAAGTSILVFLAQRVAPARKPAASTVVWLMMIAGFAITAGTAGKLLQPFTYTRLIEVAVGIAAIAIALTVAAMWGLEGRTVVPVVTTEVKKPPFREAFKQVWAEPDARRFTLFVLVSMLSYSAQDLILEPFAGAVFGFSPGASTQLSGTQHGGVFAGMLLVALVTSRFKGTPLANLKAWVVGGCGASALAMLGLVIAGFVGKGAWPLKANVFVLGLANGVFSIGAIASMMTLATRGRTAREGTRMGIWGAAQAIGFGAGGFLGTVLVDSMRWTFNLSGSAYSFVFALETVGFFAAAYLALQTSFGDVPSRATQVAQAEPAGVRA